jgi:hypothetical protein
MNQCLVTWCVADCVHGLKEFKDVVPVVNKKMLDM